MTWLKTKNWNGIPVPLFEDTELKEDGDKLCLERRMKVKGKRFIVSSVFPTEPTLTPTDKLLSIMDKDHQYLK